LKCTARAKFGADPIDPRDRSFVSANDSENGLPRYDAFISYSHAKDKPIASALQSVVQKLGKPWYRRRALRVFRDDRACRRRRICGYRSRPRVVSRAI
jgi:hypothetical protein